VTAYDVGTRAPVVLSVLVRRGADFATRPRTVQEALIRALAERDACRPDG
jgi:hypothetical protein